MIIITNKLIYIDFPYMPGNNLFYKVDAIIILIFIDEKVEAQRS